MTKYVCYVTWLLWLLSRGYHDVITMVTVCRRRNVALKARDAHLEKQISNLQKDSITQLKARLAEVCPLHHLVTYTPTTMTSASKLQIIYSKFNFESKKSVNYTVVYT